MILRRVCLIHSALNSDFSSSSDSDPMSNKEPCENFFLFGATFSILLESPLFSSSGKSLLRLSERARLRGGDVDWCNKGAGDNDFVTLGFFFRFLCCIPGDRLNNDVLGLFWLRPVGLAAVEVVFLAVDIGEESSAVRSTKLSILDITLLTQSSFGVSTRQDFSIDEKSEKL